MDNDSYLALFLHFIEDAALLVPINYVLFVHNRALSKEKLALIDSYNEVECEDNAANRTISINFADPLEKLKRDTIVTTDGGAERLYNTTSIYSSIASPKNNNDNPNINDRAASYTSLSARN